MNKTNKHVLRFALSGVVFLTACMVLAVFFVKTKPRAVRAARPRQIPIVEVAPLVPTNARVALHTMGSVEPAMDVTLRAEVSGKVVFTHPSLVEGGRVEKGEVLVRLDSRDYRHALDIARAELATAQANLLLEQGKKAVAEVEWQLYHDEMGASDAENELALRIPQLRQAEATVQAARASVARASLDVERSEVRAPFSAVLQRASVDVGDIAAAGAELAHLVGLERVWIRTHIRPANIPNLLWEDDQTTAPPNALVENRRGIRRDARIFKLLPAIEEQGRMAQILVEVANPFDVPASSLLINEMVHVVLYGRNVSDVYRIPRSAFREGSHIWLITEENRLSMMTVETVWSDRDYLYVRADVPPGSGLIVSALGAPVEGMEIRVEAARSGEGVRVDE